MRTEAMYFGRDGQPISDEEAYRLFEQPDARRVAGTTLPDGRFVSTVHLVIDHAFGGGPPLLFETMIFAPKDQDGGADELQWRWHTEAEARTGHERIMADLLSGSGSPTQEPRGS